MRMLRAATILFTTSAMALSVASPGAATGAIDPLQEVAGWHYGSVVAVSPDSAFFTGGHGAQHRPRFKHWDGHAWSNVAGIPGTQRTSGAIDADGPDDVWAVGSRPHGTLITHWDGTAWRAIHDGGLGHNSDSFLEGVSAVAPDEVWVAGTDVTGGLHLDRQTLGRIDLAISPAPQRLPVRPDGHWAGRRLGGRRSAVPRLGVHALGRADLDHAQGR